MRGTIQIRRATAALSAVIVLLVAALAVTWARGARQEPVFAPVAHAAGIETALTNGSFAPIVKRAMPAVVNISSSKVVKTNQGSPQFFNDPLFRQFFGGNMPRIPAQQRMESLGSGVIVTSDGYILTNNHVVDGATEINVSFGDGKKVPAKVIGTDPPTDIAVLKIDRTGLTALPIGDSSKAEVGDIVLAIGDPFGIGQTVTMGIVSAKSRSFHGAIENYEDFIQTDAAINQGNSGGALINTRGELVGINTAILPGNGGGNVGIGFAVPSDLAKRMMDQLLAHGKVTRGYMGIQPQEVTPDMRQAFGLPAGQGGVAVAQVEADSPAARAGLQVGDVITTLNGEKVDDANSFRFKVAGFAPGTRVTLKVLRDGAEKDVALTLELNKQFQAENGDSRNTPGAGTQSALQGVQVDNLTPDVVQQLQLPERTKGVVVTDVDESSAAAEAGLHQGDVIERVNHQPVASVGDFERAVRQGGNKGGTLLLVHRGQGNFFVVIPNK